MSRSHEKACLDVPPAPPSHACAAAFWGIGEGPRALGHLGEPCPPSTRTTRSREVPMRSLQANQERKGCPLPFCGANENTSFVMGFNSLHMDFHKLPGFSFPFSRARTDRPDQGEDFWLQQRVVPRHAPGWEQQFETHSLPPRKRKQLPSTFCFCSSPCPAQHQALTFSGIPGSSLGLRPIKESGLLAPSWRHEA